MIDLDRAMRIAIERNSGKRNQTVCRGRAPLEKHLMGAIAELAAEELGVEMNFETYGTRGDGSMPDGYLNGIPVVVKAVSEKLSRVWVPLVCLRNAKDGVVLAVRVFETSVSRLASDSTEATVSSAEPLTEALPNHEVLGWEWTDEFIRKGTINDKHLRLAESVPGKCLDRDVCVTLPIRLLKPLDF